VAANGVIVDSSSNTWHLENKAEEMRMRILGKVPWCFYCTSFLRPVDGDWCLLFTRTNEPTLLVRQPDGDNAYYCPKYIEKQPCPDSTSPPST
jgi:hypothetical protein